MRILHILDHGLPLHSGYAFRTRAIMKAQQAAGLEVAGLTGVRSEDMDGWQRGIVHTVVGLRSRN